MMMDKQKTLVETATALFAAGGYTAIGIDRIIAEAGVAKMTLYKYFPSKADLILAVLRERDRVFRESLAAHVEQHTALTDQIKAVFTWHGLWFQQAGFFGCMFINAAAEFHDHKDAVHQLAAQHKQLIIAYLEDLLRAAYPLSAKKLAVQMAMLLDGAIIAAQVADNPNAASDAWEAAEQLLG